MKDEINQTSILFDDNVPCIDTSSNDKNIVHKKTVTSSLDNTKKTIKNLIRDKNPQQHNSALSFV